MFQRHDVMQVLAGARQSDATGEEDEIERSVFILIGEFDRSLALTRCDVIA